LNIFICGPDTHTHTHTLMRCFWLCLVLDSPGASLSLLHLSRSVSVPLVVENGVTTSQIAIAAHLYPALVPEEWQKESAWSWTDYKCESEM